MSVVPESTTAENEVMVGFPLTLIASPDICQNPCANHVLGTYDLGDKTTTHLLRDWCVCQGTGIKCRVDTTNAQFRTRGRETECKNGVGEGVVGDEGLDDRIGVVYGEDLERHAQHTVWSESRRL